MRTASIRIAGAATLVCLAISACVPDETVHPFGGEVLGAQSGGGGGSSGGLVRGVAGSMGTLDATTSVGGTTAGGTTGRGGAHGTGGAKEGTGGTSAPSAECQQYIWDFDAEIQYARACNENKAKACASLVPQRLAGRGSACFTYVEDADKLKKLQKHWTEDGCTPVACPIEACINPGSSSCSVVSGLCTDGLP